MKANDDKSHLLLSSPDDSALIQTENSAIKYSKIKKLLEVHIDYKLKFDIHGETHCKKAHIKLSALSRIADYMELPRKRILMNAFFKAQFNYCHIIWMFHSRCLNNKINRLHERCLRMIYNDKMSDFEELLSKYNSVSIHHNNIHVLAIEIYKIANDMSPDIMNAVFKLNTPHYNLRHRSHFSTDPIHCVYNRTESATYLGSKILVQILAEIKHKDSLDGFNKEIKKWKPTECICKICKNFMPNLGFV